MPASGSSIFTDADGYQASLRDLLDLLVLRPRDFHARLSWVELLHLHLLYAEEAASRLAYVTLPSEQVFIIFPTRQDSLLIAGGTGRASEGRFQDKRGVCETRRTGAWWGYRFFDAYVEKAGPDYLDQNAISSEPFFMSINFMKVHQPNLPAPEFIHKSMSKSKYADSIVENDTRIGRIRARYGS